MATTVTATALTVTITEAVSLNGNTYGNTTTKTTTVVGNALQRIQAINTSEEDLLLFHSTAEAAGQVVGDNMKYLRLTNLDNTNYITVSFKTAAEHYSIKLESGDSYVLMTNQMNAEADVSIGSLEDMAKITAMANGDLCDLEIFCVTE